MNDPVPLKRTRSARELLLSQLQRCDDEKWQCAIVIAMDEDGAFNWACSKQDEETLCWLVRHFEHAVDELVCGEQELIDVSKPEP